MGERDAHCLTSRSAGAEGDIGGHLHSALPISAQIRSAPRSALRVALAR